MGPTPVTVYPRMYGETAAAAPAVDQPAGLSPHVRGNLSDGNGSGTYSGSIPACTGKPVSMNVCRVLLGVYPRMYGETSMM